ncbi:hypothetical protein GGTG_05260 [Gaeumannomyces tritici R3-111a-1]|uniref:Uncharacterized protein n=1 Tax=Gaeumannomyces tritici (strain R3-111a-1) TaxID=644352 RepID=J3NVE7_GAET3|nr:hypothetical protein GGTG_05260 [Gaeumannomyces tritici R3-111a-1]EJT75323.1 hypothetical protein GGTG_05260 [Gaeumannomyces tritici R3-111a-1]
MPDKAAGAAPLRVREHSPGRLGRGIPVATDLSPRQWNTLHGGRAQRVSDCIGALGSRGCQGIVCYSSGRPLRIGRKGPRREATERGTSGGWTLGASRRVHRAPHSALGRSRRVTSSPDPGHRGGSECPQLRVTRER